MALVSLAAYPPSTRTINISNNAFVPGPTVYSYTPDQLIAGEGMVGLVTQPIEIASGFFPRGTVLGQQSSVTIIPEPAATNVGNGSVSSITLAPAAGVGLYGLVTTDGINFTATDPEGTALGTAVVGVPFASGEVGFTITAGSTPFAAGDSFQTLAPQTIGTFTACVKTATDGSQVPVGILVDNADASGGPVRAGAYLSGEFSSNEIVFDFSWTLPLLTTALRASLIVIKDVLPALTGADPL